MILGSAMDRDTPRLKQALIGRIKPERKEIIDLVRLTHDGLLQDD